MVGSLRNGVKTAQRSRQESSACARPTFQQPTLNQGDERARTGELKVVGATYELRTGLVEVFG